MLNDIDTFTMLLEKVESEISKSIDDQLNLVVVPSTIYTHIQSVTEEVDSSAATGKNEYQIFELINGKVDKQMYVDSLSEISIAIGRFVNLFIKNKYVDEKEHHIYELVSRSKWLCKKLVLMLI